MSRIGKQRPGEVCSRSDTHVSLRECDHIVDVIVPGCRHFAEANMWSTRFMAPCFQPPIQANHVASKYTLLVVPLCKTRYSKRAMRSQQRYLELTDDCFARAPRQAGHSDFAMDHRRLFDCVDAVETAPQPVRMKPALPVRSESEKMNGQ
jgi:hypothetical protein